MLAGRNFAITIREDLEGSQLFYGSGYTQNVKFLFDLLVEMGSNCYFLVNKQPKSGVYEFTGNRYKTLTYRQIEDDDVDLDVVFEVGAIINNTSRSLLRKESGAKIVSIRYGNSLVMDMEGIFYPVNTPGDRMHYPGIDALWTTPQHAYGKDYLETLMECRASICPYIWEPDFIGEPFSSKDYKSEGVKDIYVMEPNLSVLKNALIPLTIIERIFRTNQDAFGKAFILNAEKFLNKPFFLENIARNYRSIQKDTKKIYFSKRETFENVFKRADVLLCHQWGCSLNYLYMEALYKGVPLVHNSDQLKDAGFYYPDFDASAGVSACMKALGAFDFNSYQTQSKKVLSLYSIFNPGVQAAYKKLLDDVLC